LRDELDFEGIQSRIDRLVTLGHPYGPEERENAPEVARAQAREIAKGLIAEAPEFEGAGMETKKVIALTAYMLRLGTDTTSDQDDSSAAAPQEAKEGQDAGTR